jgi:hypothetical protein
MKFGFVGPSYSSQSLNADCQRCVNWYPEMIESRMGKNVAALYPTPGLDLFSALVGPSVRALAVVWPTGDAVERVFAVSGAVFYELFSDGSNQVRGAVSVDSIPASIAASQSQLVIISGGTAYSYDLATDTFAAIAGMLGTPIQAGFTDGYFIVLLKNSKQFQISGLLDATSWNGLDTAIVSVFADNVVSMLVDHREIWLLGRKASQVYYNSGNPDFPFDVISGAFIEQGSTAAWATVRLDNSLFWLGGDERGNAVAWRAQGYTPARVSNHAVEFAWQGYSTVADAVGYPYQDQGHAFWVIRFPTANATWVYDTSTGLWHERGFWDTPSSSYWAHLSQNHVYAFGKHLVGNWNSGNVYEMSIDLYDDDGAAIRRLRRCPHLSNEQRWMFHHQLQVDLEVGLGLVTPAIPGYDPQAILRWSNDGAKTWSNDHFASAGKLGEYKKRVIWRRLGRSRDRVYELTVSDPIPWRVADSYLEISPGTGA